MNGKRRRKRKKLASPRLARAQAMAAEACDLIGKAVSKHDYELVIYKLRKIEDMYVPRWTIRGSMSARSNLLWKYDAADFVYAASFSPDERVIALGVADGALWFLSADMTYEPGEPETINSYRLPSDDGQGECLVSGGFNRDGDRFVLGDSGSTVSMITVSGSKKAKIKLISKLELESGLREDDRFVTCLDPVNDLVAAATSDGLMLLSVEQQKNASAGASPAKPDVLANVYRGSGILSADFSPNGRLLAIGTADGQVKILTTAALKRGKARLYGRAETGSGVLAVRFSPEGSRLLAACEEGSVQLYDLDVDGSPELVGDFQVEGFAEALDFHPDGDLAVYGTNKGNLEVFSVEKPWKYSPDVIAEYESGGEEIFVARFNSLGDKLMVAHGSHVRVFGTN